MDHGYDEEGFRCKEGDVIQQLVRQPVRRALAASLCCQMSWFSGCTRSGSSSLQLLFVVVVSIPPLLQLGCRPVLVAVGTRN